MARAKPEPKTRAKTRAKKPPTNAKAKAPRRAAKAKKPEARRKAKAPRPAKATTRSIPELVGAYKAWCGKHGKPLLENLDPPASPEMLAAVAKIGDVPK